VTRASAPRRRFGTVLATLLAAPAARGAQDVAGAIPGANTVTLECGHNLMAEKPDEVLDALVQFLRTEGPRDDHQPATA